MSELTKEYFEKYLHEKTSGLAAKEDLKFMATKDDIEDLAQMVNTGFEDMRELLDVRDRVTALEVDVTKIKNSLT